MERQSHIRVRTGAPLSADLERDADHVRGFAEAVAGGELTNGQIAARLTMFERRLRESRASMARALEEAASKQIEEARGHLSAGNAHLAEARERLKRVTGAM